ncbi:chromate transporter [Candidatus Avelusimicrobium luingense]|uniref:chromate transporter n=1 Tax=Candidatus Avelusimicrobium luingense TaxID=3416211 RepID=UPI003D0A5F6E
MLFSLFYTFAKIGLFTLGGGYAMLPLMEQEIVEKRAWLSRTEFLDTVALAQSAPGILAINMAILVGYQRANVRGSIFAALGAALPSFIIILLIAVFFHNYQQNPVINRIFKGVRPAVVALIAVPVFRLARAADIGWKNVWLPITVVGLVWGLHVSPIYVVLAAIAGGFWWAVRRERV